jgi:hypothetical protein
METIYAFILGIVSTIVVVAIVLGVLAFFKVRKVRIGFENWVIEHNKRIDELIVLGDAGVQTLHDRIDETIAQIERELDSRLDKLENKLKPSSGDRKLLKD